jgi:hypothetical protein
VCGLSPPLTSNSPSVSGIMIVESMSRRSNVFGKIGNWLRGSQFLPPHTTLDGFHGLPPNVCRLQHFVDTKALFLFHNILITYVTTTSCSCWHGTHSTASNVSNNSRKSHAVYRNLRNIYVKPSVWSRQLFIPVYFTSVEFDDDVSISAYSTFFLYNTASTPTARLRDVALWLSTKPNEILPIRDKYHSTKAIKSTENVVPIHAHSTV